MATCILAAQPRVPHPQVRAIARRVTKAATGTNSRFVRAMVRQSIELITNTGRMREVAQRYAALADGVDAELAAKLRGLGH
jgi:hypothetical protein